METYYLIPIIFLLVLVCILSNEYFENTNEINRLSDALRRSNINDFKAKDRQRLEDIIEQKNSEINELKCELIKVKHDYACEVAGGKRSRKPEKKSNFCDTCQGEGSVFPTPNTEVTCRCCDGTGQRPPVKPTPEHLKDENTDGRA